MIFSFSIVCNLLHIFIYFYVLNFRRKSSCTVINLSRESFSMRVGDLDLPDSVKAYLRGLGINELNPPQRKAVEKGLLDFKSMVVSSPTASGKTLIAEMAILKNILERRKKAIYIVPLRALAYEKYEDFSNYEKLGVKVAMSVGDYDSADGWLGKYDLIIVTSEKMDSLLRHNPTWIRDVGLVVVDEIHLMNDESRGPTLEVVLTRLREETDSQILGLSATISNSREIAEWLGAELVESDYRPVKLYEGVCDGREVHFLEKENLLLNGSERSELLLAELTIKEGKQALVFASSRRNAESIAERIGIFTSHFISEGDLKGLEEISRKVLESTSHPTKQCRKLAECIKMGSAFHHAGLTNTQRSLVEKAFRKNIIKVIAATPTLAAGVNLPAYRVLIRDAMRYYPGYGMHYIPVLEYQQMAGRAGRPKYDKEGEAILIANSPRQAEELARRFIERDSEEITSKLSLEPVLRMHTLSLIATGISSEDSLMRFFSKTFFAHQFGDVDVIEERIFRILKDLEAQKFIIWTGREMMPTRIGKRVAELYLDPDTAYHIIQRLRGWNPDHFGLLLMVSNTREMRPLRLSRLDFKRIEEEVRRRGISAPEPWELDYDTFISAFKTALMFEEWCDERGEDYLLEKYNVSPGGLYTRKEIADWLLYSAQELAILLGEHEKVKAIRRTRTRLSYGVREELLPLVALKGIGRVRARKLYDAGFRTIASLRNAPLKRLSEILGENIARNVKEQLGEK